MSGPLADKQQKMGEHVESIEFSLDIQLNFVFLHVDPFLLMCLSTKA